MSAYACFVCWEEFERDDFRAFVRHLDGCEGSPLPIEIPPAWLERIAKMTADSMKAAERSEDR